MLTTYLSSVPYTKFVVIEDSLKTRGRDIFNYHVKTLLKNPTGCVHYFVFEGQFKKVQSNFSGVNIKFYDCTSKVVDLVKIRDIQDLKSQISELPSNSVIIIDSLVHFINIYGLGVSSRFFKEMKENQHVSQIVSVLHTDLFEDSHDIIKCSEYLSTLSITLEDSTDKCKCNRLSYVYKKPGGKIISQIEEYWFEGGNFCTKKPDKPDVKKLIEESINPVNPEHLTTFRISLNDKEKESRDQLILPYLPKSEQEAISDTGEGKIIYDLDRFDDWDEEDPDDDLDI